MIAALLRRRQRGQVSLEMLLVFIPWFVLIMLFLNLMLILTSMMLNQATVARATQQIGSLGCLPREQLEEELSSRAFFAMSNIEVTAIEARADGANTTDFERSRYLNPDGTVRSTGASGIAPRLPDCAVGQREIPSGHYIFVQASYDQEIVLLKAIGIDSTFHVNKNGLTVSNSLGASR